MSEHEVSRTVQASPQAVFDVVSDVRRLPEWLPHVSVAEPADPSSGTDVHVEGDLTGTTDGFWRPRPEQLRLEWAEPSRGGREASYAGWLQVEDSGRGGSEVVVHLSFLTGPAPQGTEEGLAQALEALADLVESG